MKNYLLVLSSVFSLSTTAQDTTSSIKSNKENKPVKIFTSGRAINANTTQLTGRGKMDFNVTHNFDDIAGNGGGIKRLFGLDNSTDIRIGFHIGLTDRLDLNIARAKGNASAIPKIRVTQLYELALKYLLLRQIEDDPRNPVSVALFVNNVISSMNADYFSPKDISGNSTDTALNHPYTFKNFGERNSQVYQLIIAKKIGRVSLQINPTVVHRNYVPLHDQQTIFAIGGAARLPLGKSVNLVIDYFHPFRSQASKDYFFSSDNSFNPPNDIDKNARPFKFYDPLGIGFEIVTAGHVFHLNFTNATEIMQNRFIPGTTSSWSDGQFRWGFNISRTFVLWKDKTNTVSW